MTDKTGPELVQEIAEAPTLDFIMDRAPPFTRAELEEAVKRLRAERAAFIEKEQSK